MHGSLSGLGAGAGDASRDGGNAVTATEPAVRAVKQLAFFEGLGAVILFLGCGRTVVAAHHVRLRRRTGLVEHGYRSALPEFGHSLLVCSRLLP